MRVGSATHRTHCGVAWRGVTGERLVFRWAFAGPDRSAEPTCDSLLTIALEPAAGDATELTLVHERLDALHAAMPDIAENVGVGWGMALEKLAAAGTLHA